MARAKKQPTDADEPLAETSEPVGDAHEPDVFDDAIAAQQSARVETPVKGRGATPGGAPRPSGSFRQRVEDKRPSTDVIDVGDGLSVVLNDFGKHGVGIQIDLPKGRSLTDEELEIVRKHFKGEEDRPSGYRYDKPDHLKNVRGVPKMWFKPRTHHGERADEVPPKRAMAIRYEAESIVRKLAEDLAQLHADSAGFADRVERQRQEAAERDIPD